MGLERLVVKQVVKVAKDTGRLENTIDTFKIKLIDEGIGIIEKAGLNPSDLPFSPQDLMSGKIETSSILLNAEVVCSQQPLTSKQKADAIRAIDSTLASVNNIIIAKNSIAGALVTIKAPLNTIVTTGQTLGSIISTVKNAIKVIKAIPVPTAIIPPSGGIGIPINILTILSDSLDQLDKLLSYGKGVTKVIPELTGGVVKMINTAVAALNGLDKVIMPVVSTMAFVKTIVEVGDSCPNVSQNEINNIQNSIVEKIEESIQSVGDNSNPNTNNVTNEQLIMSMAPNARPPLVYKGFTLTLEENPENGYFTQVEVGDTGVFEDKFISFSFPARRIRGFRNFLETNPGEEIYLGKFPNNITEKTLYNSPNGMNADNYSFSSSVTVLFDEMVYKIDNYLQQIRFAVSAMDEIDRGQTPTNTGGAIGNIDNIASSGSTNNPGSGSNAVSGPYTLNGPNIVQPVDINSGGEVTGTLVINVPVKITMTTNGGYSNSSYTNTILQFQKGNKPANAASAIEQNVSGFNTDTSLPIQLPEAGIWNYTMKIIGNYGMTPNQSNFAIEVI